MSDLPPLKEFPRRGARGRRASAAAVLTHSPPTDGWAREKVLGLSIDGNSGRRFSIQRIPEDAHADEHRSSLEDLHLLMPQAKKMDYTLYPAMPAEDDDEDEVREMKKNSFSERNDVPKMGKRMSIVAALMSNTFSNKETKNSQMIPPSGPDSACSHLINVPEEDELNEKTQPPTATDIWHHLRDYIPWILLVTSIIQICLFILDKDEFFRLLVFAPQRIVEIWRLLSYTLLHQNAIHLALNVVIQLLLGIPLEHEQGHWRVFLVYFGGAIAGALGTSVFEPSILLIGASGGIYSVLMSHIPHTVINFKNLRYRFYRIICVIVLCTSDIIYTLIHVGYGDLPKIGISAHFLGALAGLILGTALFKSATQRGSKFKRIQLLAGAIYVIWLLSSFTISLMGSHVSRM